MELSWPALGWVDWTLLAVLAASVIVGIVRGLLFECLSLAGWVVAWFVAQGSSPLLAAQLPFGTPGSALNLGAAFLLAFLCALVVWALLARLLRLLIHATPLSVPDRLLGAAFGALRGGVLLLALATVVGLTPASQSQAWRGSRGAQWLGAALAQLKPLLPEPMARLVRT
jgi:membrane protein required for colicin V production